MAINLQKGQTINLEKSQYDLSAVTVGLGWDVRKTGGGFLGGLFGGGKSAGDDDFDLDAVAFLLDKNDKIANFGDQKLVGGDIIFFNNLVHSSQNIWLTGDNRTGAGDGDDEQIIVKLDALAPQYHKVLFIVQIYQGVQKSQHFGLIDNAFIRAVDAKGKEMVRFSLSGDANFNQKHAVVFAELYRREGGWKFRALGNPQDTDTFADLVRNYS